MSSQATRIEKNLEAFNNQLRHTSERLADRAGSAPPPEIEPSIESTPTLSTTTGGTRGKGRKRGKKGSATLTWAAKAARRLAASGAATEDTNASASGTSTSVNISGNVNLNDKEVEDPEEGLISRDEVSTDATCKLHSKIGCFYLEIHSRVMPQSNATTVFCVAIR
ncbi:uncharacterized protein MELLADRAFT_104901 [Melampsora larici-populina 98AG31]|uniref:Uncharacterized protein n=1 Tax=Melampsora larici-populina (strain 98AG31 / pathotype 3-4-7) TaxID=747676 RepID=F4RGG3_MELLP|nr:uncharacterized protein MELLADRAFT_104901 [Melampsora larici-populina 98AG31]EGG08502.1 hypothetical protein MELLADRAFT_104901 [Melampsora larici-populina 98AG31]